MGAAADFGADEASLFTEFSPPLCLCIRLERARRPCGRVLNKSVRDAMVVHNFRFSERGEKRLLMANNIHAQNANVTTDVTNISKTCSTAV